MKTSMMMMMQFIGLSMFLLVISDPHLIKTARNCLPNSLAGRYTRIMWNDNQNSHGIILQSSLMMTSIVVYIQFEQLEVNTQNFSVMNVSLAAQVFSEYIYQALHMSGPRMLQPHLSIDECQINYLTVEMLLNVRNTKDRQRSMGHKKTNPSV